MNCTSIHVNYQVSFSNTTTKKGSSFRILTHSFIILIPLEHHETRINHFTHIKSLTLPPHQTHSNTSLSLSLKHRLKHSNTPHIIDNKSHTQYTETYTIRSSSKNLVITTRTRKKLRNVTHCQHIFFDSPINF